MFAEHGVDQRLAGADAFWSLGLDRRQALWAVRGLADQVLPLFAAAEEIGNPAPEFVEPPVALAPLPEGGEVVADYRSTGLSLRRHPVAFLRPELRQRGMIRCADLASTRDGRRVVVPGIVLVRQRPGSARGVLFVTIEDETGMANLIVWASMFERQRRLILAAAMLACHGRMQREGKVVHMVTERLDDLSERGDPRTYAGFQVTRQDRTGRARSTRVINAWARKGLRSMSAPGGGTWGV